MKEKITFLFPLLLQLETTALPTLGSIYNVRESTKIFIDMQLPAL